VCNSVTQAARVPGRAQLPIGAWQDNRAPQGRRFPVEGATDWLGRYVDGLIQVDHPASVARGLTIAGFRQANGHSDHVLNLDWGDGFLGNVAQVARKCYQRAGWARHWLEAAVKAENGADFWRYSKLAEGVVDARLVSMLQHLSPCDWFRSISFDLHRRFEKSAQEHSKKRRSLLFGRNAPQEAIATALRASFVSPFNDKPRLRIRLRRSANRSPPTPFFYILRAPTSTTA
jgi:hypothetical protein